MPKRKRLSALQKAQIVLEAIREDKSVAQIATENSVHPNQIHKWKRQALEDFAQLFEDDRKGERAREAEHEKQINELYAEIGRLSAQLSWLKKNLVSNLSRAERLEMLEKDNPEMPIKTQAELLGISYSSLFYAPMSPPTRELAIKRRIDELYTACPFYGSRKIAVQLRPEFGVSRPTVQAYMREMGIFALVPGPHTSKPAPQHQIYPYLLRNVTAAHPNHIWGIDITYIRLQHGWLYLTAVLDWYSRYVVSWALSQTLEMDFVLTAVDNALFQTKPEIWNSDQGSHFTSPKYLERLQREEIKISMDGRALDNIFTERLWRTIKYEEVYLHEYASPKEAYRQLADYIRFYNFQRPHQALDYLTPAQVHGACKPHALALNSTLTNHSTLN
jgi:putative transposase